MVLTGGGAKSILAGIVLFAGGHLGDSRAIGVAVRLWVVALMNAPLVVRTFEDALRAVIELHDLPAPDDAKTPAGGGCPVPSGRRVGEIRIPSR